MSKAADKRIVLRLAQRASAGLVALGLATALPGHASAGVDCGSVNCVVLWNETLVDIIRQTSAPIVNGPPEVANQIAIVDTAMFNAVNAATGMTYNPFNYSGSAVLNADAQAAALAAGYTAMMGIFAPTGTPGNPLSAGPNGTFGNLLAANSTPLATNPSTAVVNEINSVFSTALGNPATLSSAELTGQTLGTGVATSILTARLSDGSAAAILNGMTAQAPAGSGTTPGVYVPPSAAGGRPEMYPTWGSVSPWTMTSGSQFRPGAPLGDASIGTLMQDPAYAQSVLKTECLGGTTQPAFCPSNASWGMPATLGRVGSLGGATPSNADLAFFWNDPGSTMQPPGHWLQITDSAIINNNLDTTAGLLASARVSAMVGVGLADAGIAAWDTKYTYDLWRPFNAITDCNVADWAGATNCDPTWKSLIATPPHPDYIAGHPTFSYAAATLLDNFFAGGDTSFCSTSDPYNNGSPADPIAPITICYSDFTSAALDATDSRIYGGIHTDFSSTTGALVGTQIADQIIQNDFAVPEPATLTLFLTGIVGALSAHRRQRWRAANLAA